jgi:uncharacterized protein
LADQLHYLNSSGDETAGATRYWFDTRANLRREMEERKKRFEDKNEVRARMTEVVKKLAAGARFFDGTHIFTPHSDVPDDGALRLVVLAPEQFYSREEPRLASEGVLDCVRNHGTKPRYRGNRLIFVAPDNGALARLRDCICVALAWNSIVEDVLAMRLVLDNLQAEQAKKELKGAEDVLARVARECYKWLLCPSQDDPIGKPIVEAFPLNTSGPSLGTEIERVCLDNELVIAAWSPIHLRTELRKLYWKADKPAAKAADFWEDTLRYLYLPRLKDRGVIERAIVKGAGTRDFFGTACGQIQEKFEGFKLGDANVQLDDTLLLIDPVAANTYEIAHPPVAQSVLTATGSLEHGGSVSVRSKLPKLTAGRQIATLKAINFYGSADVTPATAKVRLVTIADDIIAVLSSDPNATVKVTVEIDAEFPDGASDQMKSAVSGKASDLGFRNKTWE